MKKVLLALLVLLAVFLAVVGMQPSDFSISRSATMAAAPSTVFGHVNDLRRWAAWSPWAKMDPDMKQTYEGPEAGVGAISTWSGNNQVGEGRMTIIESKPTELVRIRLEFLKPFKSVNEAIFSFAPEETGTKVTWTMAGRNNFMSKAFCLFMDMDKMVGGDFEKGLASMKTIVEASP